VLITFLFSNEHQNVKHNTILALMKTKRVATNGLFKPTIATAIKTIVQGTW
jgi:hypothetical protein